MVTVYSKPTGCYQCKITEQELEKQGTLFRVEDITTPENMEYVTSLGYKQAPVVVTADDHWSGLQPDKIKALV